MTLNSYRLLICTIFISLIACAKLTIALETTDLQEKTRAASLRHILAIAYECHPELIASSANIRTAKIKLAHVSAMPNPEFELMIQDVSNPEYEMAFSQTIELGDKANKRLSLAQKESMIAQLDYEVKKRAIHNNITKAYIAVVAEYEKKQIATEYVTLSERAYELIASKVEAGKVHKVDQLKAAPELLKAKRAAEAVNRAIITTRKALGAYAPNAQIHDPITVTLNPDIAIPAYHLLIEALYTNPTIARLDSETAVQQAELQFEQAVEMPDLNVVSAISKAPAPSDTIFSLGIGFPIPLFNHNKAAILEAENRVKKAAAEKQVAMVDARIQLDTLYDALVNAQSQVRMLKNEIIPTLQQVFDITYAGYNHGKFDYLHVLDAQRALFEAKTDYVDTLTQLYATLADLDQLSNFEFKPFHTTEGASHEKQH